MYKYFYEQKLDDTFPFLNKTFPRPIIFSFPQTETQLFYPNEEFIIDFVLIGNSINYIDDLISVFNNFSKITIGDKVKGKIVLNKISVFKNKDNYEKLTNTKQIDTYKFDKLPETNQITLCFETPIRININTEQPSLNYFIDLLYKRLHILSKLYQNIDMNPVTDELYDFDNNLDMKIETLENNFSARHSSQLKPKAYSLNYHFVKIKISGNINQFLSLLNFGQLIHIGKDTASGFGKYEIKF